MKVAHLTGTNNKAIIKTDGDITTLQSYDTEVATYNESKKELVLLGWHSATTQRHINAFLDYFSLPNMNKGEINENLNKPMTF